MKPYFSMLVIVLSFALMSCSDEQKQINPPTVPDVASTVGNDVETPSASEPSECSLKIGFDVWEPYQYLDVDNIVRGLDVEVVSAVTKDMNCSVEFVQGTWVTLLEKLRSGNVDMLLGASKTQEREKFAFFSVPYRTEEFTLYIRLDDPKREAYKDIEAFIEHGSKIGVVSDYYYGPGITAMLDNEDTAKHFVFGIMGELNIARLLDMDIDGFLEDSFVGASLIRRKALGEYIVAHDFTVHTGDIYVMFSRASFDDQKLATFNQAMEAFKASSAYNEIVFKYGG